MGVGGEGPRRRLFSSRELGDIEVDRQHRGAGAPQGLGVVTRSTTEVCDPHPRPLLDQPQQIKKWPTALLAKPTVLFGVPQERLALGCGAAVFAAEAFQVFLQVLEDGRGAGELCRRVVR